jgi:uncharacterized protein YutE (UPF0331/DUF86 family)
MSKKATKNLKRDLLLEQRERLLKEINKVDNLLDGEFDLEEAVALFEEHAPQWLSYNQYISWLKQFIEHDVSDIEERLSAFVDALEEEFPCPSDPSELLQNPSIVLQQSKVRSVIQLHLDSSLILYAFRRYSAAIIELHGALERQAVERLVELISLPEKADVGLKAIERRTLPELAVMLRDCGVIDKDDIKFIQKLNRLRNGLAHRNAKVVSNALLSGQEILNVDIDATVDATDYVPLVIRAIHLFVKIFDWYEESLKSS